MTEDVDFSITIRKVNPTLRRKFKALCYLQGKSMSTVLRGFVEEYVEHNQQLPNELKLPSGMFEYRHEGQLSEILEVVELED